MVRSRASVQLAFLLAALSFSRGSQSATSISPQWAAGLREINISITDGLTTLTSDTARPFEMAIEALRAQYNAIVCYEDPEYIHADDVIDRKLTEPRSPKMLIPSGGKLVVSYNGTDVAVALAQLTRARLVPDRGAHFSVIKAGSVYMVVPALVRDSTGAWGARQSVLDAHITMPAQSRGAEELLKTILQLTAQASARGIQYGWGPGPDRPGSTQYQVGAQDESARSVLLRALPLMAPQTGPIAWELLFDPQTSTYVMNFMAVPNASTLVTPAAGSANVVTTPANSG